MVRRRLSLFLDILKALLRGSGGLAIAAGTLVHIGWLFDITLFKTLYIGTAAMRPLSAWMTIVLGFSLVALSRRSALPAPRRAGFWMAVLFAGLAVFTVLHTFFAWTTPLDGYLYRSSPDRALNNSYVGCVVFLSQAASILLLWAGRCGLAQGFALLSLTTTYLGLTGYLYDMGEFQRLALFHSTSLPYLLVYSLTAIGLLASRPQRGLVRELIS
ncbi:MAG TPA: hypothetical protein VIM58_00100, partial [Candidatus Methylacidiphilales bacterium]